MKNELSEFSPLKTRLGIVPFSNWGNASNENAQSQFWYKITDAESLILTWQNVLENRIDLNPVSFQLEWTNRGKIIYRYDFSRLSHENVTNVFVGFSPAQTSLWCTNSLPKNITSLTFDFLTREDKTNPDKDNDGIDTASEIFLYGTNPASADTDNDGLSDLREIKIKTNPLCADVDGDGLTDKFEYDSKCLLGTSSDTDIDGLPDAWELQYDFDPNDDSGKHGPNGDADMDGVLNIEEYRHKTNPRKKDTDGDGIEDEREKILGTNSQEPDSDGDGNGDLSCDETKILTGCRSGLFFLEHFPSSFREFENMVVTNESKQTLAM